MNTYRRLRLPFSIELLRSSLGLLGIALLFIWLSVRGFELKKLDEFSWSYSSFINMGLTPPTVIRDRNLIWFFFTIFFGFNLFKLSLFLLKDRLVLSFMKCTVDEWGCLDLLLFSNPYEGILDRENLLWLISELLSMGLVYPMTAWMSESWGRWWSDVLSSSKW